MKDVCKFAPSFLSFSLSFPLFSLSLLSLFSPTSLVSSRIDFFYIKKDECIRWEGNRKRHRAFGKTGRLGIVPTTLQFCYPGRRKVYIIFYFISFILCGCLFKFRWAPFGKIKGKIIYLLVNFFHFRFIFSSPTLSKALTTAVWDS